MTTFRGYYGRWGGYLAVPSALAMALGMLSGLPPGLRLGLAASGGLMLATLGVVGVALTDAAPLRAPLAHLLAFVGFAVSILLLYNEIWLGGLLLVAASAVAFAAIRRITPSQPNDPDPEPPGAG